MQKASAAGSADLDDFMFAFFQNCFMLREWIKKTSPLSKGDLDNLFNSTPELRICRDICNGTKHYSISKPSVDAEFSILREYDPSEASGHRLRIIVQDKNHVADGKYDLLELAGKCLRIWEGFLAPHITQ